MDWEDAPSRPNDALTELVRQDLDRFSVGELRERITALEGEIERCRRKIEGAVHHRASADQLFKR